MPLLLAISAGDVTGIGPEVTLKAIASELAVDDCRYLLIGDEEHLGAINQQLGLQLALSASDRQYIKGRGRLSIINPLAERLSLKATTGAPGAARAAVAWLKEGARRCLTGECAALVTAPVNKEAIIGSGETDFVGQTEFLSALAGTNRTAMMLLGHDDRDHWLRVVLATTHVPLRDVASQLTGEKIALAIELAAKACRDLQLPRARIAVCGLNPHAGEGGHMGDEEQITVGPAVRAAQAKQLNVIGPLPADTLFHFAFRGDYDAVVAMYHDQGLVPLKMIGFETGVNWTLGLPFVRTSPDHGTAYEIAGKGIANPSSMIAAIRLAKKLARPTSTGW